MSSQCAIRWKGALHGVNYENWRRTVFSCVSSTLLDLSCQVIVRDATFTRAAVAALPHQLYYALMRAAIERGRHSTIKVLLEAWPSQTLSVSSVAPHLNRSGQVLYDSLLYSMQLEDVVRLTSLLIHTFIQLVQQLSRKPSLNILRTLDLSGFPVVEPVLQLVSHNIAEHHFHYDCPAKTLQTYSSAARIGKRLCSSSKACSCEPYVIRMDCFIHDGLILDKLHHALTVCSTSPCHLKLDLVKVNAICLGEKSIAKLMTLLEPEVITGMGLEYNAFCNEGLIHLCPQISMFFNLTALDLSCNGVIFTGNDHVSSAVGHLLRSLTKLRRLDLSNNKLSRSLSNLFVNMTGNQSGTLEFLKLSACQLKDEDVKYLASCPHIRRLKELDLSENVLASRIRGLIHLLGTVRNTLLVLELEDCGFTGSHLPSLFGSFGHLRELRYLNISRNDFPTYDLCQSLPVLRDLPNLECIRLSSSYERLDESSESPDEDELKNDRCKVESILQEGRADRVPILVAWDYDITSNGLLTFDIPINASNNNYS